MNTLYYIREDNECFWSNNPIIWNVKLFTASSREVAHLPTEKVRQKNREEAVKDIFTRL